MPGQEPARIGRPLQKRWAGCRGAGSDDAAYRPWSGARPDRSQQGGRQNHDSPILTRRSSPGRTLERVLRLNQQAPAVVGLLSSEEHTSELQSLMRISYAVSCLKKKT